MAIIDWEAARRRDGYGPGSAGAIPECDQNGSSPKALAAWNAMINNAWCRDCRDANASFAPGHTLRADKFGIVIEGKCAKCGCAIVRCSY